MFKAKDLCSFPLLFMAGVGIVFATHPSYTVTPGIINNGGGVISSPGYSTNSSIGQLASGIFSSASYQVQADILAFPDTDGDLIPDNADNCQSVANADQVNTDSDTLGDACDPDDDNDGLSDTEEATLGTDPLLADTDGDGLDDGVDPNPLVFDANGDLAPYGAPDGIINAADLDIARQIMLGVITPTSGDIIRGDLYPAGAPDGVIDMSDLILLEQLVLSPAP